MIEILDHWKNSFLNDALVFKKGFMQFFVDFCHLISKLHNCFSIFFNSTNCMNSKTSLSTKVFLSSTFYFHVSDEHPKKVNVAFNGNWSLGLVQKNKLYSNYLL